ncbi:hypothetical protein RB213_004255, partial [Colletotrichum asianum]
GLVSTRIHRPSSARANRNNGGALRRQPFSTTCPSHIQKKGFLTTRLLPHDLKPLRSTPLRAALADGTLIRVATLIDGDLRAYQLPSSGMKDAIGRQTRSCFHAIFDLPPGASREPVSMKICAPRLRRWFLAEKGSRPPSSGVGPQSYRLRL